MAVGLHFLPELILPFAN